MSAIKEKIVQPDNQGFSYTIKEGFNHYWNYPLYSVHGTNNDYVGEWTRSLSEARNELNNLLGDK